MADSSTDNISHERSTSHELRKRNKPLMEKKRRERINICLDQLKALLLDANKKEGAHHSKLEKADILEMTVKYLKSLHQHQISASPTPSDPLVVSKYIAGYNECATEVTRYLRQIDGVNADVHSRLLNHLSNCLTQSTTTTQSSATSHPSPPAQITAAPSTIHIQVPGNPGVTSLAVQSPTSLSALQMQLIPGKLPSGEVVLFLPVANAVQSSAAHIITSQSPLVTQSLRITPMTSPCYSVSCVTSSTSNKVTFIKAEDSVLQSEATPRTKVTNVIRRSPSPHVPSTLNDLSSTSDLNNNVLMADESMWRPW